MQIYWAGGEDLDFPYIGNAGPNTGAGVIRSGWSREAITPAQNNSAFARSAPFNAGPQTSAWLTFYWTTGGQGMGASQMMIGFGQSSSGRGFGLSSDSTSTKITLARFDGTTRTQLAVETATSMPIASGHARYDMQVTNFGVTATVNIYCNYALILNAVVDLTQAGMTSNFDCVTIFAYTTNNSAPSYTEIVVADSDTRQIQGLQTLALTGSGTTNNWSNNTFSNINQTTMTDTTPTSVNTTAQDQQYNITDGLLAAYSVIGIVISARVAKTAASVPTQIKLGYNSGGSVAFGTGAAKTPGFGFAPVMQIDMVNPVTGVAFLQSEINALQLDLQSA
jgi:hypothetical protein